MLLDKARAMLEECESHLRGLLAEAAARGDYDAVLSLTRWAQGVAAMRAEEVVPGICLADGVVLSAPESAKSPRNGRSGATRPAPPKKGARRRGAAARYPKFIRIGNQLGKIGWSKKRGREYLHKAPRSVLDVLVKQLVEKGSGGRLLSAEEIFDLPGQEEEMAIPSYQLYLCLAWLRTRGLIEQVGRQGYRVARAAELPGLVEHEWGALASPDNSDRQETQ